ncbi:hypothetical protein H6A03_05250 [[Clostridium] spiroforme]|nr:hypothetical protein [Thomasclavelia spiroformis]MBM6880178.1 hypothetical protein [Thomasclavelia spiroformis]
MKDEIKILYSYKTVDEFKETLQSYLNFYINIRSQKRFKGKTSAQIREETMLPSLPERYPTLVNYEIRRYWSKIKENTS